MTVQLNPYLNFRDNARQAIEFYHSVFGGELRMNTFADLHAPVEPGEENLIMHSAVVTDDGINLMAADTPSHMQYTPAAGFSVSLSGDDESRLRGYWDKLSGTGTVIVPLELAPWGDTFGMCVDSFGINWLVNILGPNSQSAG